MKYTYTLQSTNNNQEVIPTYSRKERTLERYKRAGAAFRLFKVLAYRTMREAAPIMSTADQDRMHRAIIKIENLCSQAESSMFYDHPKISNDYLDVFYGDLFTEPRNDIDREVLQMARELAGELFEGKK